MKCILSPSIALPHFLSVWFLIDECGTCTSATWKISQVFHSYLQFIKMFWILFLSSEVVTMYQTTFVSKFNESILSSAIWVTSEIFYTTRPRTDPCAKSFRCILPCRYINFDNLFGFAHILEIIFLCWFMRIDVVIWGSITEITLMMISI